MAKPQDLYEIILQDQADLWEIINSDNKEIAMSMPIEKALEELFTDLNDTDMAESHIIEWMQEEWFPMIQEQLTQAELQAAKTALAWETR